MKTKSSNDTQSERKRRSKDTVINLTEDTSSEDESEISKIKDKKLYIKIKREDLQKKLRKLLKDQVNKKYNTSRKNEKTENNSIEKMKKTSKIADEDNESPTTSKNSESKRNSRKRKIEDNDESSMNYSYENKKISRTVNVNKKSVQKENGKSFSSTVRKFENKIFIRFPDIQKINSKEKNKTQKRRSRRPKEIREETIKEKFGVKFIKCYIKIKRLKQSVLKSNLSLRQRSSGPPRSVSFVDTVEVFSYYSSSRGVLNTSSPSTSKEESNEKKINDTSINEEIHEIGMTSTPNKQEGNEPESEKRHSKKRKIIESDSDSDSDNFIDNLLTKNKSDMSKENDKKSLDIENENDKIEKNENKSEDDSNELKTTHENQKNIKENDDEEINNSISNENNQIQNSEKLSEPENKNDRENLIDNEQIDIFNVHGRKSYKENKSLTKNENDKTDKDKDDASVDNDSANKSKPISIEEKDEQFHDALRNNDDDDDNDDERQKSSDLLSTPRSIDSYKSAKNDIDNVNAGVEKSTESRVENDAEGILLTDDEDDDAVKQNDKDNLIESSIEKNADNNDDSNDSFFGLSKVNENKTINTEDLFDIVKNSDVSAKLPLPNVNENKFKEHNDTDIEDISTIDDNIDGSDSNRNSPSSILLKSNPNLNQIKYDEKITKSITTVTETVTETLTTTATTITSTTTSVLNNDNDDNFCDISNEYIMGTADTTENPTDLLNDIDSLQFPGTNSNNQDNMNVMNIEQTLNNDDDNDNNKKDDKKLSKFTFNKLVKMFH